MPDGVEATGSGSPIRVTGLRAGVSYTFTVQAINAIGDGPMSAVSNAVTPAAAPDSSDRPGLSDVTRYWAEAAVQRAVKLGLMKGYPDGTFRPEDPVTRQETAVVFIRLLRPDPRHARSVFRDADAISAWASDAVSQAAALNLMVGYGDGTFRPSARLTRSELAVLVRRVLALEQALDASGTANSREGFGAVEPALYADDGAIPPWARGAVYDLRQLGIIGGRSGNRFEPAASVTRAEAAVVLLKYLDAAAREDSN